MAKVSVKPSLGRTEWFFLLFFLILFACILVFKVVMGPLFLASVVGYILNPWIEAAERKGLSRTFIVSIFMCVGLVLTLIVSWFLIPALYHQASLFVKLIPDFKAYLESHVLLKLNHTFKQALGPEALLLRFPKVADLLPDGFSGASDWLISNIGSGTRFLFSWVLACILLPPFVFFIMRDFRKISIRFFGLIPPDLRRICLAYLNDADHTLRAVLRGQIVVISLLATLYSIVFLWVGLPAGLIVGLLTGVSRLIPYMDLAVGGTLCFLILVTHAAPLSMTLGVVFGFLAIQLLDGLFFTPRIMGQFSGLHPFLIILSVLCMADWFGFYGALLAIPSAALLRVTLMNWVKAYKHSEFFGQVRADSQAMNEKITQ